MRHNNIDDGAFHSAKSDLLRRLQGCIGHFHSRYRDHEMIRPTVEQRLDASIIIRKLLETFEIDIVAHELGVRKTYIYFAASLQQQIRHQAIRYLCPAHAIRKILEFGNK